MLLANMAVAHKIHRAFPEQALLRRHPPPQTKMLNDLVEFCDQMGLPMDFSSAGALNVSAGNMGAGEALLGKAGGKPEARVRQPIASHQGPCPLALSAPQGRQEALGTRPSSCRAWRGAQETEGVPSGLAVGRGPVGRDGLSSGFLRALGLAETRSCFSWGAVRYSPPELSVM